MTKLYISGPVLISGIALILLSVQFATAQNTGNRTIIGTWLFSPQLSFSKMDKKADDSLKENPQLRSRIQSAYTGKQITFLGNGVYSQVLSSGKKATGQWQVNGNSLVITDAGGNRYAYSYRFIGNDLVISSVGKTASSASVVPHQYFTQLIN